MISNLLLFYYLFWINESIPKIPDDSVNFVDDFWFGE